MYLKALELQGFKSFPEKTVIHFEQNVTAIVGPNGSGKSNISDALLWVMGEQRTKALRGAKMEDVIFGGTMKRSPMGFAQVTLILDNSARIFDRDCDEIAITRRYYRSGESEYFINKEDVRLKDVAELLMDTGLGRDGYSIIGQGRIAEIVSAKSTDRREIFEEAAGISRFRHRKEESERKLERTEENLLRIGDKISELELQVEPLRKQSETAKKYLLLRDELRQIEISLWMENLDRLHDQSEGLRRDYNEAVAARDTAQKKLDTLYMERDSAAERMQENDLEMERQRERQRAAEVVAAETESSAAVLRTNIENTDAAIARMEQEMAEQAERSDSLQKQIEEHRARLEAIANEQLNTALESRELRLAATEAENGRSETNAAISVLLLRESELKSTLSENRSADALLRENLAGFDTRASEIRLDRETGEAKLAEAEAVLSDAKKKLSDAEALVTRTGNMVSGRSMLLEGRERSAAERAAEREKLSGDLRALESRLSLLRAQEKELDGFNNAVKTVMSFAERGALRGVHGPLARLIRAKDEVALAVETALGGALQNVVVDTQRDGKDALNLLKQRNGGRATFYPLDVMRANYLRNPPETDPGFVGLASELVDCDDGYRELIGNLLGRTVVAETLDDAARIANKNGHSFKIVTLDGQVLNAGGSMTGGSAAKNTGMLSRANEIEKLGKEHDKLERKLGETVSAAQEASRRLEQLRQELDGAREENAAAREALSRAGGAVAQAQILRDAAAGYLAGLEEEENSLSDRKKECADRIDALAAESAGTEEALRALSDEIAGATQNAEEVERKRRELDSRLSELHARTAALESEHQTVTLTVGQLEALLHAMESESGDRRNAASAAEAEKKRLCALLQEREETLSAQKAQIEGIRSELMSLSKRRMEIEAKRAACDRETQEMNRELMEKDRTVNRLDQGIQNADNNEKNIVDKLWDTYELSRTAAQALRQPLESFSKATRQVAELRRSISALGTPNLGAIDEYKRVSERYDFLTEQRDDVLKAKTEIENIIRDITAQMEDIFRREFAAIDECFRTTFLELFGGGKAALSLEDENDVLNCGINIRIQPPGKALSNISLLSGGEKSFVAIALYFAIMKVRPTPFCIMDEIESALDEKNVAIYAEYMHRMSDKTQFIVITHRRGTMEAADALYGVTMQEKGVSTVLNMNVREAMKAIGKEN